MHISIFSDELYLDIYEALPIFKEWGMTHVDFRGRINGKLIEKQTDEELYALKAALDSYGLKPGVIQSSLCKVHLPDEARQAKEMEKLEGIIRAAKILGTPYVRSFFFWQHKQEDPACGELAMRPDALAEVLDMFAPFAKRAKEAGLILGFENCGVTPDEVICVLEALNVPEWGMAWDVSNMFEFLPEAEGMTRLETYQTNVEQSQIWAPVRFNWSEMGKEHKQIEKILTVEQMRLCIPTLNLIRIKLLL